MHDRIVLPRNAHQYDEHQTGHQRDELGAQRKHLCPVSALFFEWLGRDMDAERKDGEQRRHEHGKDVVEQQEDGHQ